jgi:hypothetical protein
MNKFKFIKGSYYYNNKNIKYLSKNQNNNNNRPNNSGKEIRKIKTAIFIILSTFRVIE